MPSPVITFDGIGNIDGYVPGDPNGDVGPNYYVQMVNMQIAVFDKSSGAFVLGPESISTLWSGFGGSCETTNNGDPIVLYDSLADRWFVSQLAMASDYGPFYQCVAISTSPDPTGSYYRYAFLMSSGEFNDYPKFGVWPGAYLMTVNQFSDATQSGIWEGAGVWALDRAQMLAGVPSATTVYFDLNSVNTNFGSILPADVDGSTPPPAGSPGYFAEVDNSTSIGPVDALRLWQLRVDWSNPQNATLGNSGQPNTVLNVAPFNYLPCVNLGAFNCIPQPIVPSSEYLDAVGDRLMHRLAYRNFGDHESLVMNHTVDAGTDNSGNPIAGVRWYEVRDPGGTPNLYQQGTYNPDSTSRWMASIAMDHAGNIAMGYSASSTSVYPSVRYTGRLATDRLGQMARGEGTIVNGLGSQESSYDRWGDYSAIAVDPVDDCTFWYTNQYYVAMSNNAWHTRIGSFRFPSCSLNSLSGAVTDAATGAPLAGALVTAINATDPPTTTWTDPSGVFTFTLSTFGAYTVTAQSSGYAPGSVSGIALTSVAPSAVANIALTRIPFYSVSGVLRDIVSGAPLSGTVDISGSPLDPPVTNTLTDASGYYSVTLAGSQTYTLTASALFHRAQSYTVNSLSSDLQEDFQLWRELWLLPIYR